MKTNAQITALLVIVMFVFSSCRELTVTTRVNRNGSFTRLITVTGDSSEVLGTGFPFPVDETWAKTVARDTAHGKNYIVQYSKSFRDSDQLNLMIAQDTSRYRYLDKTISVVKRPGFFYSYLTFKEVYKCANPFHNLDYNRYISGDALRMANGEEEVVTPADSTYKKEAEDKILTFLAESACSELESITRQGIKKINDPRLNRIDIGIYHDSLMAALDRSDFNKGRDVLGFYSKWTGTESFSRLDSLQPALFQEFDNKIDRLDRIFELEGYTEEVEMPGLITGTNSAALIGNRASWDFEVFTLFATDREFWIESRVINYWAFILSGIVLLGMIVLLAVKVARK